MINKGCEIRNCDKSFVKFKNRKYCDEHSQTNKREKQIANTNVYSFNIMNYHHYDCIESFITTITPDISDLLKEMSLPSNSEMISLDEIKETITDSIFKYFKLYEEENTCETVNDNEYSNDIQIIEVSEENDSESFPHDEQVNNSEHNLTNIKSSIDEISDEKTRSCFGNFLNIIDGMAKDKHNSQHMENKNKYWKTKKRKLFKPVISRNEKYVNNDNRNRNYKQNTNNRNNSTNNRNYTGQSHFLDNRRTWDIPPTPPLYHQPRYNYHHYKNHQQTHHFDDSRYNHQHQNVPPPTLYHQQRHNYHQQYMPTHHPDNLRYNHQHQHVPTPPLYHQQRHNYHHYNDRQQYMQTHHPDNDPRHHHLDTNLWTNSYWMDPNMTQSRPPPSPHQNMTQSRPPPPFHQNHRYY